jgi:hypothetical protein
VLKNRAARRDPALCGYCKCSHIPEYAALSKTPHALADGLMVVFQPPAEDGGRRLGVVRKSSDLRRKPIQP